MNFANIFIYRLVKALWNNILEYMTHLVCFNINPDTEMNENIYLLSEILVVRHHLQGSLPNYPKISSYSKC